MEKTNPELFFGLVEWFNNFSNQLYTLYSKISKSITQEFKLKEIKRYANSSLIMPWIADVFHMGFKGSMDYSVHVMTILNKMKLTHESFSQTPSIIIIKIGSGGGAFLSEYWNLFSEENLTIEKDDEGFINGEFKVGGEDWKFNAFQVDLELFNSESADSVISKEILPKLRKMLE